MKAILAMQRFRGHKPQHADCPEPPYDSVAMRRWADSTELFRRFQRTRFMKDHPSRPGDEGLHPDKRMIGCAPELVDDDEWETRHGRGYVLSDGTYYDPLGQTFHGITTED